MRALWFLVLLGSMAGGYSFFDTLGRTGMSAPQQAAGMAIAIAFAVIPYCFLRACQFIAHDPRVTELRQIRELLETHTRLLATVANATDKAPAQPPSESSGSATA